MLFESIEIDKKLAYLVFRQIISKVAHTQIEEDVARLPSLGIFKHLLRAGELLDFLFMLQLERLVYI